MENAKKVSGQKFRRCDHTDSFCDNLSASGTECLICVLGFIRSELSDICEELSVLNENREART